MEFKLGISSKIVAVDIYRAANLASFLFENNNFLIIFHYKLIV